MVEGDAESVLDLKHEASLVILFAVALLQRHRREGDVVQVLEYSERRNALFTIGLVPQPNGRRDVGIAL